MTVGLHNSRLLRLYTSKLKGTLHGQSGFPFLTFHLRKEPDDVEGEVGRGLGCRRSREK